MLSPTPKATGKNAAALGRLTVAVGLGVAVTTGHGFALADTSDSSPGSSSSSSSDSSASTTSSARNDSSSDTRDTETSASDDSDATKPEDTEPDAEDTEPDDTDAEPEDTESEDETSDAEVDEPDVPEVVVPEVPVETTPDVAEPDVSEPDADAPEIAGTAAREVEVAEPVDEPAVIQESVLPAVAHAVTQEPAELATAPLSAAMPVVASNYTAALLLPPPPAPPVVTYPAPVRFVLGLLRMVGVGPGVVTPAPTRGLPFLLELAWVALRRIDYRLFNESPSASYQQTSLDADAGVVTGQIIGTDPDDQRLRYTLVTGPTQGTVTLNADGTYTYVRNEDLAATAVEDSFTVKVSDDFHWHLHLFSTTGHSDTVTVAVSVPAADSQPTIAVAGAPGANGTTVYTVTTADGDGQLGVTVSEPALGGTVTDNGDGTYTYAPDPDYAHALSAVGSTLPATDTMTFTVTDADGDTATATVTATITPTNTAPVITVTQTGTNQYSITVTDPDDPGLTVTIDGPQRGTLTQVSPGIYEYTPDPDFVASIPPLGTATDVFFVVVFTATDGAGATATATTTVTVAPVNSGPRIERTDNADGSITFTFTDEDGDDLDIAWTTTNARITDNGDGSYTFTPDPDYAHQLALGGSTTPGTESVSYSVNDGHGAGAQVFITRVVTPQNTDPVIAVTEVSHDTATGVRVYLVTTADEDGDTVTISTSIVGGTLTRTGNLYTFTPDPAYAHDIGRDVEAVLVFAAVDGYGGNDYESVMVVVPFTNAAPEGSASVTGIAVSSGAVAGTVDFTDADGDDLTYTAVVVSGSGTVTVDPATGAFVYTPATAIRTAASLPGAAAQTATIRVTANDGFATGTTDVTVPIVRYDNQIVTSFGSGLGNFSPAISPDGKTVAVAASSLVNFIDTSTGVMRQVNVPANSQGVVFSPDGKYAYVGGSNRVTRIDVNSLETTLVYNLPSTNSTLLAISPDGTKLYAVVSPTAVRIIDSSSGVALGTIVTQQGARHITISDDGTTAYIANTDAGTVTVANAVTGAAVRSIDVGPNPYRVVASPDGTQLYVTNQTTGTVSVVNADGTGTRQTINVGATPWGLAITPDGSRVYVANNGSRTVSVIDTRTNQVISTISMSNSPGAGPLGVAISEDGKFVYVTSQQGSQVAVISVVPAAAQGSSGGSAIQV